MDPPRNHPQAAIIGHPPRTQGAIIGHPPRTQGAIIGHPPRTQGHLSNHRNQPRYYLESGPVTQLPGPPSRSPAHLNVSKDSPYPVASPSEDVSGSRSPSMAHQHERRTHYGERLFNPISGEVRNINGFANKENWIIHEMVGQGRYMSWSQRSNQQEPYSRGCKTPRDDHLESSTITIDNVKSKIHCTPHLIIDAWFFGILSILAFAMTIHAGSPTSIDRWSASGTIFRLVFILGTQPLWKHQASTQARRDLEGTTERRAVRGFLRESQSPIEHSSSRRALSSPVSQ